MCRMTSRALGQLHALLYVSCSAAGFSLPCGRGVESAGVAPRAVVHLPPRFAVLARFQRGCPTASPCMPRSLHRGCIACLSTLVRTYGGASAFPQPCSCCGEPRFSAGWPRSGHCTLPGVAVGSLGRCPHLHGIKPSPSPLRPQLVPRECCVRPAPASERLRDSSGGEVRQ